MVKKVPPSKLAQLQQELDALRQRNNELVKICTSDDALCELGKIVHVLDSVRMGVLLVNPEDRSILEANKYALELMGLTRENVVGQHCCTLLCPDCKHCPILDGGQESASVEKLIHTVDGRRVPVQKSVTRLTVAGKQVLVESVVDISDFKEKELQLYLDEVRFEALYSLSQMTAKNEQEILNAALEAAVKITSSEIGYIFFVSEDQKELKLHAWSKSVMDLCTTEDVFMDFRTDHDGLWQESVKQMRAVIANDYANTSEKKGVPKGHVEITRHMSLPLVENGKALILVGVGNKEEPYDDEDVRHLTAFLDGMWQILQRKRAEDALREAHRQLENRVKERTEELEESNRRLSLASHSAGIGIWDWNPETGELYWDDYVFQIYGVDEKDFTGNYNDWYDRVLPEDREGVVSLLGEVMDSLGQSDLEFRIVRPDGETRFIRGAVVTVKSELDGSLRMIGVNQDVTEQRETEFGLRRIERIFDHTPDLISLVDVDHKYVMMNSSYGRYFERGRDELIGQHASKVVGKETYENITQHAFAKVFAGEDVFVESWMEVNGRKRFLSITYHPVPDHKGKIAYAAVHAKDLTQQKKAEYERQRIFEVSIDLLCISDFAGVLKDVNPAWEQTLGWKSDELIGKSFLPLVHPEDYEQTKFAVESIQDGSPVVGVEMRFRCSDDSYRWLAWNITPDMEQGDVVCVARDVTKRRIMEDELRRAAATDSLTGADNRRSFLKKAAAELERSRRYGVPLAVFMLDIDHFKKVNDTYGHEAGDEVLKSLVQTCLTVLRSPDVFGRFGGEEFAAMLIQVRADEAEKVCERLRSSIAKTSVYTVRGKINITVSIGVSMVSLNDTNVEDVLRRADNALYEAKQSGRNMVIFR
ncbi:MAG: diguanylate cyclase [Desulfovibrio sp.]